MENSLISRVQLFFYSLYILLYELYTFSFLKTEGRGREGRREIKKANKLLLQDALLSQLTISSIDSALIFTKTIKRWQHMFFKT